jgi:hypothetical protein
MVGLDWSSGAPLSYPAEIEKSSHIRAIFLPRIDLRGASSGAKSPRRRNGKTPGPVEAVAPEETGRRCSSAVKK